MIRLYKALIYSLEGLIGSWRTEPAFRLEVILSFVMIPIAFFITSSKVSLLFMIGSILLVLALELVNTAIEAAVDYTGKDIHPLAKKAKDAASAAVFVALINVALVWAVVIFV